MVELTPFPHCCGADILYSFTGTTKKAFMEEEETTKKLLKIARKYVGRVAGADSYGYKDVEAKRNRIRLAILSDAQTQTPRLAMLKRMGFQFVTRFYNNTHSSANGGAGGLCYLFMQVLQDHKEYPVSPNTPPEGWDTLDLTPPEKPVCPNPFEKLF